LAIALQDWKLADGSFAMAYFGISASECNIDIDIDIDPSITLERHISKTLDIRSVRSIQAQHILTTQQQRHLALDATPAFVLATGRAVEGMLASGVADYLEFKTVEGLYWLLNNNNNNTNNSTTGGGGNELSRVPCSKNDVFGTKLLKPMDKRRLMKFIQLSMDYATQVSIAEELQRRNPPPPTTLNDDNPSKTDTTTSPEQPEEGVQSLNERHLNQGRSLARPQNKAVATQELQDLQTCMKEQKLTFDEFLAQQKLSPTLRSIVRYALALETESKSTSLAYGMDQLRQHLQALGRFGTTAFLVPMYGSGELSQAFCRSAAVFGATYLLRRAPVGIDVDHNNHQVQGVILAGDKSNDYPELATASSQQDKRLRCSQVVVSVNALIPQTATAKEQPPKKRLLRRISILNGKLNPSTTEQRHIIILPPQSHNIGNSHAIHCVTLDDSVQVAPPGCTVLHLTTTIKMEPNNNNNNNNNEEMMDTSVLDRAYEQLAHISKGPLDEIYQVTFSHALTTTTTEVEESLPNGLHVCQSDGQVLTADVAFAQAQQLFDNICPGMEFLGLSKELDQTIQERAAERGGAMDDDEQLVLESALGMIEAKKNQKEDATTEAEEDNGNSNATPEANQPEQEQPQTIEIES
jgi:RAB protein geranylgeranyltransferase component A